MRRRRWGTFHWVFMSIKIQTEYRNTSITTKLSLLLFNHKHFDIFLQTLKQKQNISLHSKSATSIHHPIIAYIDYVRIHNLATQPAWKFRHRSRARGQRGGRGTVVSDISYSWRQPRADCLQYYSNWNCNYSHIPDSTRVTCSTCSNKYFVWIH